jgi:hypothetical protein
MPNQPINTFNAGVLTQKMDCRVDVDKYAAGCRHLDNMIPVVWGGAKKRPGTKFIYASSAPINLIKNVYYGGEQVYYGSEKVVYRAPYLG